MKDMKYITVLVMFLVFAGCTTIEYYQRGREVTASDQIPANSLIYALPKTTLTFEVTLKKTMYKHGPYYRYAEKYLGITEVSSDDWEEWSIADIDVVAGEEVDPEHYYLLESNGPLELNAMALAKTGLIISPDPKIYSKKPVIRNVINENPEPVFHTDLSVKRNFTMIYDTNYRFIETDTGFVQVPYLYERNIKLTREEQAEEAANFIIKIRKRRFKLMSGQYDVFPEGIALQYAVENLTVLEQEYIALFIGKYVDEFYKVSYRYIPTNTSTGSPNVLFRFSPEFGAVPANDLTGKPVFLELTAKNTTRIIDNLTYKPAEEGVEEMKPLFYRIPEVATLKLLHETDVLAEKEILVYQYGQIVRMPVNFMLKQ
jgi:hypothetical protein